jgi:putative PIN family toxin of toxin-antitoxin system
MRLLLDTNILVSSVIANGSAKQFFTYCLLEHTVITSEFILKEFQRTLKNKFQIDDVTLSVSDNYFRSQLIIAHPLEIPKAVILDPDDDNIIAAAIAGKCDYIITGDKALLEVKKYENVKIVSMQEFRQIDLEG